MEFTQCVEEAVTQIQLHYDGLFLQQNEIIAKQADDFAALLQRVERIEKMLESKRFPVEVDVVATKTSLKKLKDAVIRALHF